MIVKRYLLASEWINNIMIVMLFCAIAGWALEMMNLPMSLYYVIIAAIVVCHAYLCRVYITKLYVYAAAHALLLIVFFFIPLPSLYKVIGYIWIIIMAVCDMIFWTSEGTRSFIMLHPATVTFFVVIFIYASWKEKQGLINLSYILGVCYTALVFLRIYLLNVVSFANDMQVNENTPLDEMLRHNGGIIFPLVTAFTAGMFLIQSEGLAAGLSRLVHLFFRFLGRIIVFILKLFPASQAEEAPNVPSGMLLPDLYGASVIPEWLITALLALEKVLTMIFVGAIVYFIIAAFIKFIRIYFIRHGYDISAIDTDDHVEVKERIRHNRRRRINRLSVSMEESARIRHRYKKEVQKLMKKGYLLKKHHTPRERSGDVGQMVQDQAAMGFEELTFMYEKARYSK